MLNSLRQNAYVFSGFKAYHELKEASTLLITEDGKIKPFNAFKQDVLKVHEAYNVNYLEAEYNFAVSSAQMAVKWNDYEQDGDNYNLQYRTAGDEKVRADHAILNGTTLPASDPFWDEYVPPLDWNCRCTIVQVLKDKYELSNSKDAIANGEKATTRENTEGVNKAAMFRFNPGKTLTLFPDKHPYFPRGCADCDLNLKLAAGIPKGELCTICKILLEQAKRIETFNQLPTYYGTVNVSSLHGKNELIQNSEISTYFANKYNQDIVLLLRSDITKMPDAFNKSLGIYQEYKVINKKSYNAIDGALRIAKGQAKNVVLKIEADVSASVLESAITSRVKRTDIESVWVRKGRWDKNYTRKEILAPGFKIQWD